MMASGCSVPGCLFWVLVESVPFKNGRDDSQSESKLNGQEAA
jgi:hypothetical protein